MILLKFLSSTVIILRVIIVRDDDFSLRYGSQRSNLVGGVPRDASYTHTDTNSNTNMNSTYTNNYFFKHETQYRFVIVYKIQFIRSLRLFLFIIQLYLCFNYIAQMLRLQHDIWKCVNKKMNMINTIYIVYYVLNHYLDDVYDHAVDSF